jgi:hypothetical protein
MDADLVASVLPLVSQVASGAPARLSVPRGPLLLSLAVQSALGSGALRLFRTSVVPCALAWSAGDPPAVICALHFLIRAPQKFTCVLGCAQ